MPHSSLYINAAEIRIWSHCSLLQTGQRTQNTVCCRVPLFMITERETQGLFKILDYRQLRIPDIAQILKKKAQKGVVTQNRHLSYYHDIMFSQSHIYCTVAYCAPEQGHGQNHTVRRCHNVTERRLNYRQMTSISQTHIKKQYKVSIRETKDQLSLRWEILHERLNIAYAIQQVLYRNVLTLLFSATQKFCKWWFQRQYKS